MKVAANRHALVQRFGTVHKIRIDTESRTIEAEIGLKGESGTIGVTVHYNLDAQNTQTRVMIDRVRISREWLDAAARLWLENQGPVTLPFKGLSAQLLQFLL